MPEYQEAIETIQDMLDVLETHGSCYVYKHNGGDNRLRNVLDCLRAQELAEDNEPLTLDELRRMDGKPVWLGIAGGVWGLVDSANSVVWFDRGGSIDFAKLIDFIELEELAYRHKPEEETK